MPFTWRSATKADRTLLEQFECALPNGPDFERRVQRYFRVQAIRHMGSLDGRRTDHRLLLVLDDAELVAVGCHRKSRELHSRNFVFAAVSSSWQGRILASGSRASDALWEVVANDILDREEDAETTVVAKVDPDNARSLAFCKRIGLKSRGSDHAGLVICAGTIARSL